MAADLRLRFDGGTLVVSGGADDLLTTLSGCRLDPRLQLWRAEARHYRAIVERLRLDRIPYQDEVRAYEPVAWQIHDRRAAFPHQREALDAWWKQQGRGIVVLPTGTGKTYLAILAIEKAGRPALVITPTIDLLNQWYDELVAAFNVPVGLMGGGYHERQNLTVTTYDSAAIHVERWGNRFGLVIFDEAHHLPGPTYQTSALGSIAPYRLGLTATLERADGQDVLLPELIGPVVYRKEIQELAGDFLAEYRTQKLYVELDAAEQKKYQEARQRYRGFVEARGISVGSPGGWRRFLQETYRSPEGRAAFQAYREQKRIAQAAPAKLKKLEELLETHRGDRTIIFTADNATVYRIARQFLVPAITHQTRTKERREILLKFHEGIYPVLVTSQVLNEGVNVPAAGIGIILSGTGSVREHVQRLGRLLRKFGDKQALLYELVTRDTAEEITSDRRRQHRAYE